MSAIREIPKSLEDYLDSRGAYYAVIRHARDYQAQWTAFDTLTPACEFAKCVVMWADNSYCLVVIPADCRVDLAKFQEAVAAQRVGMASEREIAHLFPDCEPGAEPPIGQLYDMPVFVDAALAGQEMITFNGGTHECALRMPYEEFVDLASPEVIDCAVKMDP